MHLTPYQANLIQTAYDISLNYQDSLLPLEFSPRCTIKVLGEWNECINAHRGGRQASFSGDPAADWQTPLNPKPLFGPNPLNPKPKTLNPLNPKL